MPGSSQNASIEIAEPIKYKDFYFRLFACLIAAHYMIMMSESISTLKALTLLVYYPTLAINYLIALILAYAIRKITIRLDRKYSWENEFWVRLILQFAIGVGVVALLAFFLVFIYFISFGQDIMASTYPKYEFPFSVALLVMLNAYYTLYYFYFRVKRLDITNNELVHCEHINVYEGKDVISIQVDKIACVFIFENCVIVRTLSKQDYLIDQTLDELESKLDPTKIIFRINRQLLAQRKACKSYSNLEYGKLKVEIEPQPLVPATVSQRKAAQFREWMA